MAKIKYDFNGTLLNLLLLGGAAVILKKRTGSLRGVGATHSKEWIIDYISHRLDVYDRQLPKLTDKNAIEKNVAVQEELHSILKHIYF